MPLFAVDGAEHGQAEGGVNENVGPRKEYNITRLLQEKETVNKFLVLLLLAFGLTAALAQPAPEPEAVAFCSKLTEPPTQLGKMPPPAQALSPPETPASPRETPASPPETPAICVETVSRYLRHEPQQFPAYKTPDAWVRIFWACKWAEKAGQEPNAAACNLLYLKALKEKPPAS